MNKELATFLSKSWIINRQELRKIRDILRAEYPDDKSFILRYKVFEDNSDAFITSDDIKPFITN
jgi:hypothetical protein